MSVELSANLFPRLSEAVADGRVAQKTGRPGQETQWSFAQLLADEGLDTKLPARPVAPRQSADQMVDPRSLPGRTELSALETLPTNSARSDDYRGEVRIGDDAIAFDSRPILAPTAVDRNASELRAETHVRVETHSREIRPIQMPFHSAMTRLEPRNEVAQVRGATPSGQPPTAAQPSSQSTAGTPALIPIARGSPAQVAAVTGQTQSTRSASTQGQARAAPAAAPPAFWTHTAAPAFAQLIASPSECRISLRGQRLSDAERSQLIADVSATLRHLGLPFNPIQLIQNGSRG